MQPVRHPRPELPIQPAEPFAIELVAPSVLGVSRGEGQMLLLLRRVPSVRRARSLNQ